MDIPYLSSTNYCLYKQCEMQKEKGFSIDTTNRPSRARMKSLLLKFKQKMLDISELGTLANVAPKKGMNAGDTCLYVYIRFLLTGAPNLLSKPMYEAYESQALQALSSQEPLFFFESDSLQTSLSVAHKLTKTLCEVLSDFVLKQSETRRAA